ncbi:MAG: hypothetical protein GX858_08600, partial [Clostridiales bacterium]|nr:hypothetical protein [Clostridiales bacterium]
CYFEPDSDFVFVLFSNGGSMVRENRIGKLARKMFTYFYDIYGNISEESLNADDPSWVVKEAD